MPRALQPLVPGNSGINVLLFSPHSSAALPLSSIVATSLLPRAAVFDSLWEDRFTRVPAAAWAAAWARSCISAAKGDRFTGISRTKEAWQTMDSMGRRIGFRSRKPNRKHDSHSLLPRAAVFDGLWEGRFMREPAATRLTREAWLPRESRALRMRLVKPSQTESTRRVPCPNHAPSALSKPHPNCRDALCSSVLNGSMLCAPRC